MPIGSRTWRWFGPRWRAASPSMKTALVALLVCGGFLYVFLGPLVFDASYWVLGKVAAVRADRRLRARVSVAVVVLYLLAVSVSGSTPPRSSGPGGTSPSFVAANPTSPSLSPSAASPSPSAPTSAATTSIGAVSASPVASSADPDDETSGTPGASFAPNATGILAPKSGAGTTQQLPGEPNPALTPGALNPAVTQATIGSTICVSGWTATIRPSESFTDALKVKQIGQYGYGDTSTSDYEEDHLISLELGGAPADARNLWPEPYTDSLSDGRPTGARTKDTFETKLKTEVCAGTITLAQGQADIGDHWVHAYYGIALTAGPTNPAPTAASTAHVTSPPTTPIVSSPPVALRVTFVSLPDPAPLGGVADLEASTSPGAKCTIVVTWPSGSKSAAKGLKTSPTAAASGIVSWEWNVSATTKPGTAKATVTCTLRGVSAQGTARFPVG